MKTRSQTRKENKTKTVLVTLVTHGSMNNHNLTNSFKVPENMSISVYTPSFCNLVIPKPTLGNRTPNHLYHHLEKLYETKHTKPFNIGESGESFPDMSLQLFYKQRNKEKETVFNVNQMIENIRIKNGKSFLPLRLSLTKNGIPFTFTNVNQKLECLRVEGCTDWYRNQNHPFFPKLAFRQMKLSGLVRFLNIHFDPNTKIKLQIISCRTNMKHRQNNVCIGVKGGEISPSMIIHRSGNSRAILNALLSSSCRQANRNFASREKKSEVLRETIRLRNLNPNRAKTALTTLLYNKNLLIPIHEKRDLIDTMFERMGYKQNTFTLLPYPPNYKEKPRHANFFLKNIINGVRNKSMRNDPFTAYMKYLKDKNKAKMNEELRTRKRKQRQPKKSERSDGEPSANRNGNERNGTGPRKRRKQSQPKKSLRSDGEPSGTERRRRKQSQPTRS